MTRPPSLFHSLMAVYTRCTCTCVAGNTLEARFVKCTRGVGTISLLRFTGTTARRLAVNMHISDDAIKFTSELINARDSNATCGQ